MTKKSNPIERGRTLTTWTLRAPLLFGAICAAFFTVLTFIGLDASYLTFITPIVFVIAGIFAIRRARTRPIDRASYVAIDNGITILNLIVIAFLGYITPMIPTALGYAMGWSRAAYVATLFVIFLLTYYMFGLTLLNLYGVYLRCVQMGVKKWKIILTMPFTMLYCPAYFLDDARSTRPVVQVHSSCFSRLNRWVLAKPINAIICYMGLMGLSVIQTPTIDNAVFSTVLLLIFGLFMAISGTQRAKKNIGGAFTTISIFINILFIVWMVL